MEDGTIADAGEERVEDGDVGDDYGLDAGGGEVVDVDTVTEVVRMFEEDEDAAGKELVDCATDGKSETKGSEANYLF